LPNTKSSVAATAGIASRGFFIARKKDFCQMTAIAAKPKTKKVKPLTPALQRVLDQTEKLFVEPSFSNPACRKKILGNNMPDRRLFKKERLEVIKLKLEGLRNNTISDLVLAAYEEPLLNHAQEQFLFRKYNFLKMVARNHALSGNERLAVRYLRHAHDVRNLIMLCNVRLALNFTRGVKTKERQDRPDMMREANVALLKTIDYFDWTRETVNEKTKKRTRLKFSSYASWGIINNLWIHVRRQKRQVKQLEFIGYIGLREENADKSVHKKLGLQDIADPRDCFAEIKHREAQLFLAKVLRFATERQQEVFSLHYGLAPGSEPLTTYQVGDVLGLTGQRIRQLIADAMERIREGIAREGIEYAA
jgi:RNA polymerase sigma factor (sigma-70 family)